MTSAVAADGFSPAASATDDDDDDEDANAAATAAVAAACPRLGLARRAFSAASLVRLAGDDFAGEAATSTACVALWR
jgi:hypothetical protein